MGFTAKVKPVRRPNEFISTECRIRELIFLCPHCNKEYHVTVSDSIFYDRPIDRSLEGLVLTYRYFCKDCGDYAFQIDTPIVDSVKLLRQHGIHTISSCSGHAEKFTDRAFMYEGDALYISDNEITYGPCISIAPFNVMPNAYGDESKEYKAFDFTFNTIKDNNIILLDPKADNIGNYFFIAPVADVKEFRRAGESRRTIMLNSANYHMHTFVKRFCHEYKKELTKLEKEEQIYE